MKFNSVTAIGLGLIGGSVCKAIKKFGTSREVVGIDSDKGVLEFAIKEGIIDRGSNDLNKAIDSEFVVVATYVDKISEIVEKISPNLKTGCVITDVGSVKSDVVTQIDSLLSGEVHFVGSHPIAGKEHSGIENSDPGLFSGNNIIVTPTERSEDTAIKRVTSFWRSLGGDVISLDPKTHDQIFAYVSHLPHLVAYSLVNSVATTNIVDDIFSYSGGGLKDYTRVAASSPKMWKAIFLRNKDYILESIKTFKMNIEKVEYSIKNEDMNELMHFLENVQELKLSE